MLCEQCTATGISIKQTGNDADVPIIETAIEQFERQNTIVGEDVDLLKPLNARICAWIIVRIVDVIKWDYFVRQYVSIVRVSQTCSNIESNITDDITCDINKETTDPFLFLQQRIKILQREEEKSEKRDNC